jgi:hypothetical protein
MTTESVRPTYAGDNKYFVTVLDEHGQRTVDAVSYSQLTAEQKLMSHALDKPDASGFTQVQR